MLIATKIYLGQELKKAKKDGDKSKIAMLTQVLDDNNLVQLVHEANQAEYEYVRAARLKTGLFGGVFQDFLAYLFENRTAILEFILQIIQIISVL